MLLDFILYYKATVIKNSIELAKKQTLRSMEQNRAPRNKLILKTVMTEEARICNKDCFFKNWCWKH